MDFLERAINHRFNLLRLLFRKLCAWYLLSFRSPQVSEEFQQQSFNGLELNRAAGLAALNKVLNSLFEVDYSERNGMFSEHLILLAAISIKYKNNINKVLEIGTYDGRTSLILAELFKGASIRTIDLPSSDSSFLGSYNRRESATQFEQDRDKMLSRSNQIVFHACNSICLAGHEDQYDLIWIDGAHGYPVLAMDIVNCYRLCKQGGYILVDDLWETSSISDKMYRSGACLESIKALKEAGLITDWSKIHKRLGSQFNLPWKKKFVALFRKRLVSSQLFLSDKN